MGFALGCERKCLSYEHIVAQEFQGGTKVEANPLSESEELQA